MPEKPPHSRNPDSRPLPPIFYNTLTILGGGLAVLSLLMILLLMLLEALSHHSSPYMGILAFVVLPAFLLLGSAIAVAGIIRQHRRRRRGLPATDQLPRLDLNDPSQLRATILLATGGVLILVLSAIGSFKAYEYTDSDEFCGTVCHEVMHPEFTAYGISPHARVGCVKCHIGPGAEWFVRSKLSGAYQVYAVLADKVPRPIETPIKNLRPSRDTCEQCHWPAHFKSDKMVVHDYYAYDEENTHSRVHLLMKTGGGGDGKAPERGIHWEHAEIRTSIEYIATDDKRLEIPWVKSSRRDGSVVIYRSTESDLSDEELAAHPRRKMDCIDCHNRPTHQYGAPARMVNQALAQGRIDPALPGIKELLVDLMSQEYETTDEALTAIDEGVHTHYMDDAPEVLEEQGAAVDAAVAMAQGLFRTNIFPEMKVRWAEFPDHIGHLNTPGCFRCHDGLHESENGQVISRDCDVCHTIMAQERRSGERFVSLESVEFQHPEDIDQEWKETGCSECHGE